jgi:hypothetical protein
MIKITSLLKKALRRKRAEIKKKKDLEREKEGSREKTRAFATTNNNLQGKQTTSRKAKLTF